MRILAICVLLAATGCSGETAEPVALPITAPMTSRDMLLHDLEIQKRNARERADQLEQATAPR